MGGSASHPVEAVRVQKQRGPLATACVAEMQGWRDAHEDAHFMCQPDGGLGWATFGVLDGHSGQKAACLASEVLPVALKKATKGRMPKDGPGIRRLQTAYEEADEDLRKNMNDGLEVSGTTSISAGVKVQQNGNFSCYLANCGDSRGILVRLRDGECGSLDHVSTSVDAEVVTGKASRPSSAGGEGEGQGDAGHEKGTPVEEAKKLLEKITIGGKEYEFLASVDHKPNRPDEEARIIGAGGTVKNDDCPRVDGNLAVSRGLADFVYKSKDISSPSGQKISCWPELYEMRDMQKGDIIILACDGVFDVMANNELVELVVDGLSRKGGDKLKTQDDIGQTCVDVLQACLKKGSRDNMTTMIIQVGGGSDSVKKSSLEQELTLPEADKLKSHLEDSAAKKSYTTFVDMCKTGGCDLESVPNISMVVDDDAGKKTSESTPMHSMSQKERLQKKLEDRRKAGPTQPAEQPPATAVEPAAKPTPSPVAKAAAQPEAKEQPPAEAPGGVSGKKKKKKKAAGADASEVEAATAPAADPEVTGGPESDAKAGGSAGGDDQKKKTKPKGKKK